MVRRLAESMSGWLVRRSAGELLVLFVSLLACLPAWVVKHPPLEDLPFHASTISVLHHFDDPAWGLHQHFVLTLGRTQYLIYYVLGSALSYVMQPITANRLLMSVYLAGTPLSLMALCKALGRDERLALLAVPLLFNVMYQFGLLPFLAGIPVMFCAMAAFARHVELGTPRSGLLAGVLAIATFYSHLFPFALLAVGCALLFPWGRPHLWGRACVPYVPLALLAVGFLLTTQAGELARGAVGAHERAIPMAVAFSRLWLWTGQIYKDQSDEVLGLAWFLLVLVGSGLAQRRGVPRAKGLGLIFLPALCFYLYFTTGQSRGMVWLFAQRFPVLGLFALVPFLRLPRGLWGHALSVAAAALGLLSVVNTCRQYVAVERYEMGDIDGAIANIPPASTVAALIFDKYSRYVEWSPFVHAGSYYQLEKGGMLQFNFAPWPHWPFAWKHGVHPPEVTNPAPRWEWLPEQRDVRTELAPNYEYLMVRGSFAPPDGTYRLSWSGDRWSVWQRDASASEQRVLQPSVPEPVFADDD